MTYYEELGISPLASEEEVRRAHRLLTKILHPDQQTDENLQRLAGLQLRRINLIADCLLDPAARRDYDQSLKAPDPPVSQRGERALPRFVNAPVSQKFWRLATVALLAGFVVAAITFRPPQETWAAHPAAPVEAASRGAPPSASRTPQSDDANRRIALRPVAQARDLTLESPPAARPAAPKVIANTETARKFAAGSGREFEDGTEPVAVALPPSETQPAYPANTRAAPAQRETSAQLAGTWIYAPRAPSLDTGKLYRPEYIELKVQAEDGVVFGQYKGRYVIPDRPISPTVAFQFTGKFAGNTGSFAWRGTGGGSAGQVELKLLTERTLQVDWKATQANDSPGLISGTAVLIRRN